MSDNGAVFEIAGHQVEPGRTVDIELKVSESYTGLDIHVPVRAMRGKQPGPAVFVMAGIHGDELNGTGIIRRLLADDSLSLKTGTLVLVPHVNVLGLDTLSRYLPDRRDLNRSFPGSPQGSLASRFAAKFFREIVKKCDYGIDLHSAAVRRTNFPNIRADMSDPKVRMLAESFGCELIVHGTGPSGSLRRAACRAGIPTIILEAGEVWKIEPSVAEFGVRGVRNVLAALGLISAPRRRPAFAAVAERTTWVRARHGGFLDFHVAPGEIVEKGEALATNSGLLGSHRRVLTSPVEGIVLGMTTLPAVSPGDPVFHIAVPNEGIAPIRKALRRASDTSLTHRLRDDLATNVALTNRTRRTPDD
jgi:predicted deacylase